MIRELERKQASYEKRKKSAEESAVPITLASQAAAAQRSRRSTISARAKTPILYLSRRNDKTESNSDEEDEMPNQDYIIKMFGMRSITSKDSNDLFQGIEKLRINSIER